MYFVLNVNENCCINCTVGGINIYTDVALNIMIFGDLKVYFDV